MLEQLLGQLMAQSQIHLPGEQQLIDGLHQLQTIRVGDRFTHETEIQIRAVVVTAHRPRSEQPHLLHAGVLLEKPQQLPAGAFRDARNRRRHIHNESCSRC